MLKGIDMATKPKAAPIKQSVHVNDVKLIAKLTLDPKINAAAIVNDYAETLGEQDGKLLVEELANGCKQIKAGDLHACEEMLFCQAQALQTIFANLTGRARRREYLSEVETYLRLAMKAQSQCVRTLEVLAAIKNPPVVIAKQANIAHGHQQVNNVSSRVENEKSENELLKDHYEKVDQRATPSPSLAHSDLGAMATIDRGKDT
jgi:hypothetical protein